MMQVSGLEDWTSASGLHTMEKTSGHSDLRIVLLGYRNAGKSSAGNTILGREEFELKRTAQCVKRQREVAGRHITVVEAPGWFINVPVEKSTELLKQEIVLSVSLCPPGPHTLLMAIRLDTVFKEDEKRILMGYMNLLTERVWSHTIVLFTCGDRLGDTPIEQHIESEEKELRWLVKKCGNRYHVLNNKNRADDSQVTELLEKIEEMVAVNSGRHFEMDRKILQEVEEKRRAEEERVRERVMKVQKQIEDLRSVMRHTSYLSELRIVLLGERYAGKSSAGNTILGREESELKRTAQCVKRQREVAGRHITVVEAPGWWIDEPVEKCTELLKQEIGLSVSLCPPGPNCLLLVIRVDIGFKANEGNIINGYMKLLGERVWSHTIVLFTCGDCLGDTPIEQHIESEGKELQWLVEKCRNRYHVLNNKNRADDTQVTELLEKIEEMVAANSGRIFKMGRKILQEVEEPRRAVEVREKEMMKVEKKSKNFEACNVGGQKNSATCDLGNSACSHLHPGTSVHYMSSSTDSSLSSGYSSMLSIKHDENRLTTSSLDKKKISAMVDLLDVDLRRRCFISHLKEAEPRTLATGDPLLFTPERLKKASEIKNNHSYRFLCCHAGQFQCTSTSLVFDMEGKGEVLYGIDCWDSCLLDGLGTVQPAGPLYNINCFGGSISHLRLPHCKISSGKNPVGLVVAHLTGENIEVIQPLKVTNTHVIISVPGLSFFGLVKKMFFNCSMRAQILIFYKEISGQQSRKKLHMHLLPSNVPVEEVEKRQKGYTYFETSSTCKLTPGRKYKLSCGSYTPQPKTAVFEHDYDQNYHPTFVVISEIEDVTVSLLDEDGTEVWEPHQIILSGDNTDTGLGKPTKGVEFVNDNKEKLIQKVSSVMEIADCLQSKKMITDEMYSNMQSSRTPQEQMRILYRALDSGGSAVKEEFYQILKNKQRFLVSELESGPNKA